MTKPTKITVNANQAVAQIAYKTNEILPIYPITPSSEMAELVEEWSAKQQPNIFGNIPTVLEMQSEAGVAGTMHGALQTGSLSTTFTASQGLLLMLPNMYKIAGELTPNVINVATRSIATHALSIFGDHSDIMAVRSAGYAMLGAASVQEAHDFALIAQAASLQSRIPFVHFFDGFRTSHEIAKIEEIPDEVIREMIDQDFVQKHYDRALDSDKPILRGTSQCADTFFQSREAVNPFYDACPDIVQHTMDKFANLTGRRYNIFDYIGHENAEYIIIAMASSSETVEQTINYLNTRGEKYGLVKVRLFRPFSTKMLIEALPESVKSIAVLDRTKEPGAAGEPLYLDVLQSILEAFQNKKLKTIPKIVGGRYGLSSREFTPAMVKAVYQNLKQSQPENNFTIGIDDDITHLSLPYSEMQELPPPTYQALFYQKKTHADETLVNNLPYLIGNHSEKYVQAYTEFEYKKSDSRQVTNLRISPKPIKAPYLINVADFIACEHANFLDNDNVLSKIKWKGILLINTTATAKDFWYSLSAKVQNIIIFNELSLYVVDIKEDYDSCAIKGLNISAFEACFLQLNKGFPDYNFGGLSLKINNVNYAKLERTRKRYSPAICNSNSLSKTLAGKLIEQKRYNIKVSELPVDGTYPTDTAKYLPAKTAGEWPKWNAEACLQCGACSMACPQGAIRMKVFDDTYTAAAPLGFSSSTSNELAAMDFSIQVNTNQCNSCNHCVDACDVNALKMVSNTLNPNECWGYFESIPELNRVKIDNKKLSQQQLQEPLFKYPTGDRGCGEAAYLKLLSQLFGERLVVANATGTSSIFGGALPTTPWSKNSKGKGPAWSNSLFEDNAEFGLGFRLSIDYKEQKARSLLKQLMNRLDFDLVHSIISAKQNTEIEIIEQQNRIVDLKQALQNNSSKEARSLLKTADNLVKKSVWCVGGDGWAYDIGYAGLDHVIASGENVNILVLDNEVYANTGGQMSKATPQGARSKFASAGKKRQKKDLGLMALNYEGVYVASVAIGADPKHTLNAFVEAESFDGPSVIIAYCHSRSHGIDMKRIRQYHKAAVNAGQWLLYRNDPRRISEGLNPLQLDANKPSIKIEDYLKLEYRFHKLFQNIKTNDKHLINQLQDNVDKRFKRYKALSNLPLAG